MTMTTIPPGAEVALDAAGVYRSVTGTPAEIRKVRDTLWGELPGVLVADDGIHASGQRLDLARIGQFPGFFGVYERAQTLLTTIRGG